MCQASVALPNRRHVVGDVADIPLRAGLLVRQRVPEHADLARVLLNHGHEQPDRRRLAGAVRADEAHDLAALEAQRHVVEREELVALADAAHFDRGCVHGLFFSRLRWTSRSRASSSSASRPSSAAISAAASRCSSSSCSFRLSPRVDVLGDERPAALALDDDAGVLELEVGALDGDDRRRADRPQAPESTGFPGPAASPRPRRDGGSAP